MANDNKKKWVVPPALINKVREFEALYKTIKRTPIVICGPSGVGKSLFIKIFEVLYKEEHGSGANIHRINCAAFNEQLLLSELFGHKKGAFTGADKDKAGHIKQADGGVLVLEEIGDIPKTGQAQLLTFLEDGSFYPVGSEKSEKAEVQIIATTNRKQKDFREDFWYRLFPFNVPPIHERRGDILYYFAHMYPDLLELLRPWEVLSLLCYNWPGNVREIERLGLSIQWGRENDADYRNSQSYKRLIKKYPRMKHLLGRYFSETQNSSGFNSSNAILTHNKLTASGVDVSFLDKVLGEFGLGLSPFKDTKPSFSRFRTFEREYFKEIDDRYSVLTCSGVDAFDLAFEGLMFFYCSLFMRSEFANKDLLDIQEKDFIIPVFSALHVIEKPTAKHYKLEKEIFEFCLGKRLPMYMKRMPIPLSPEHHQLMLSLEDSDDRNKRIETVREIIGDMSQGELEILHNEALLKRMGGNKTRAAERKGISRSTFTRQLKKAKADPL